MCPRKKMCPVRANVQILRNWILGQVIYCP